MDNEAHEVQDQVIPGVTSGNLLDVMENPDAFQSVARGDLYVQLAHMRRMANSPEMPMTQRLEYSKFLAKMGQVDAPKSENHEFANVPMIEIDLGQGQQVRIGSAAPSAPREEKDVTPKPSKAIIP